MTVSVYCTNQKLNEFFLSFFPPWVSLSVCEICGISADVSVEESASSFRANGWTLEIVNTLT